jgi:hypothetical protein
MLHHGASLFGNEANGSFSDAVLMMRADAGEVEFLIDKSFAERRGLEDTVVAMVVLDFLSTRLGNAFEGPLGDDRV